MPCGWRGLLLPLVQVLLASLLVQEDLQKPASESCTTPTKGSNGYEQLAIDETECAWHYKSNGTTRALWMIHMILHVASAEPWQLRCWQHCQLQVNWLFLPSLEEVAQPDNITAHTESLHMWHVNMALLGHRSYLALQEHRMQEIHMVKV